MVGERVAIKAAEKASSALSKNFLEVEGDLFRVVKEGRKKALVPVRVKVGVNPLNVIGAAAAGLAGVLAATVAWQGVRFPGPLGVGEIVIFPGLRETTLGGDLNRAYERMMVRRRIRASGGEVVESRTDLTPAEFEAILTETIGDDECRLLNREWQTAMRQGRTEDAAVLLQRAKDKMCPWVKNR